MAIKNGLLSDLQLRHWVKAGQPLAKSDGGGLTFTISANGCAAWILRYRYGGRRYELTLGRYPGVADLVLLGGLGHRGAICFAQDRDHLLFRESTLLHGLLFGREPSS